MSSDYLHRNIHEYVYEHSSHIFPNVIGQDVEVGQEVDRFSYVPWCVLSGLYCISTVICFHAILNIWKTQITKESGEGVKVLLILAAPEPLNLVYPRF